MSCTPMISPPIIPLPGGTTISPPSPPPLPGDKTLCCKLISFNIPIPPIPLPPLVIPGVSEAIALFLKGITDYLDSLPMVCPKE